MAIKRPKPLGKEPRFTLEPGVYWMASPGSRDTNTWSRYSRVLKEENSPGSYTIIQSRENPEANITWVVIDVESPITLWKSAIFKHGHYQEGDTAESVGLWEQADPSFIHDASEALDRIGNYGDALGKLSFAIGLAGVGLFLFSMRRK